MPYQKEVYRAVREEYAKKRRNVEKKQLDKKNRIFAELPALRRIEMELMETASRLSILLISRPEERSNILEDIKKYNMDLQAQQAELLVSNGYPIDYLEIEYECKKCNDEGVLGVDVCDCYKKALRNQAYNMSRLGKSLSNCTFDSFSLEYYSDETDSAYGISPRQNMKKNLKICKDFCKKTSKQNGLLFIGPTGLGKTFLSAAIARGAIHNGLWVVYETANKVTETVLDVHFGRGDGQTESAANSYYDCDVLLIDDLGTECVSQYTVSVIYDIINMRTIGNKRMLISTNKLINELEKLYDERIVSRLIGDFLYMRFFGDDIRQLKLRSDLK